MSTEESTKRAMETIRELSFAVEENTMCPEEYIDSEGSDEVESTAVKIPLQPKSMNVSSSDSQTTSFIICEEVRSDGCVVHESSTNYQNGEEVKCRQPDSVKSLNHPHNVPSINIPLPPEGGRKWMKTSELESQQNRKNAARLKGSQKKQRKDLMFKGGDCTFQCALEQANIEGKPLLVNIQSKNEICDMLNSLVFSNKTVRNIIKNKFVFWQQDSESPYGSSYVEEKDVNHYPHLSIFTDKKTIWRREEWTLDAPPTASNFLEILTNHVDNLISARKNKKKNANRKIRKRKKELKRKEKEKEKVKENNIPKSKVRKFKKQNKKRWSSVIYKGNGGLGEALAAARVRGKYLMVCILSKSDKTNYELNRFLLASEVGFSYIQEGFVIWKQYEMSSRDQGYIKSHVGSYPHMAIFHPNQKKVLWKREWTDTSPPQLSHFVPIITGYESQLNHEWLSGSVKRPPDDSIGNMARKKLRRNDSKPVVVKGKDIVPDERCEKKVDRILTKLFGFKCYKALYIHLYNGSLSKNCFVFESIVQDENILYRCKMKSPGEGSDVFYSSGKAYLSEADSQRAAFGSFLKDLFKRRPNLIHLPSPTLRKLIS